MLKYLVLLLSLVGQSRSSVVAVASVNGGIPTHSAIGGNGEFIRDPIADSGIEHVLAAGSKIVPAYLKGLNNNAVHDVVGSAIINGAVPNVLPAASNVVRDVVPGSRAVVHDVVPGSHAVVPDVIPAANTLIRNAVPRSRAVVHDVVPASRAVVHDVVPRSRAIVHDIPRSAGVVHDVVPVSGGNIGQHLAHTGRPASINALPRISFPTGNSFFKPDNGIGTSAVAPSARYLDPASLKCGLKPEPFIAYQLSRFSYNYPRYEIQKEFEQRPEIRPAVLALATNGRFSGRYTNRPRNNVYTHRNKREAGRINGCMGEALTLRTFYAYNNYCWLVAPVYQDVPFYNCYQGCNYSGGYASVSRCEASYIHRKVLAYCAGLPYGKRIGYVNLPVPTACSCKTYKCTS